MTKKKNVVSKILLIHELGPIIVALLFETVCEFVCVFGWFRFKIVHLFDTLLRFLFFVALLLFSISFSVCFAFFLHKFNNFAMQIN